MTTLEKQLRAMWLGNAEQAYFGMCDKCRRVRGEDDKPLLVARQPRRHDRECIQCFDARVSH